MSPRGVLFRLHLVAGSIVGLHVFLLCATGLALAFERQIGERVERGFGIAAIGPRLSLDDVVRRARLAAPGVEPTSVTERNAPELPVAVGFGRDLSLLVDPYTGAVLGEGAAGFFRVATDLHRSLGARRENRDAARAVTGASTLAFLFLAASGIVLWVPRPWTRHAAAEAAVPRRAPRGRAGLLNWHKAVGLWVLVPCFGIALTGVVMAYPWANDLLYRAAEGRPAPPPPDAARRAGGREKPRGGANDGASLDALRTTALAEQAGWRTLTLRMPGGGDPITASVDRGRPDLRVSLTLDRATGAVVKRDVFALESAGRRWRTWVRFAHTGEAGGVPGQALAAVGALGGMVLTWTGLSLAWGRLIGWLGLRDRAEAGTAGALREAQ